jgi:predicted nuclease of predicted toxin-antitoxin system
MNQADRDITDEQLIEWFSGEIKYRQSVAYYHDENIPVDAIANLYDLGVTSTSVYDQQQDGEQSDFRVLRKARSLGCILVTIDKDYREIHRRLMTLKNVSHSGILFVKNEMLAQDAELLSQALYRLSQKFEEYPDWLQNQFYQI